MSDSDNDLDLDFENYSIPVSVNTEIKSKVGGHKKDSVEVIESSSEEELLDVSSEDDMGVRNDNPKSIRQNINQKRAISKDEVSGDKPLELVPYYNRTLDLRRKDLPSLSQIVMDSYKIGITTKDLKGHEKLVTNTGIVVYKNKELNKSFIRWQQVNISAMKKHAKLIKGLGIPWETPYIPVTRPWYKYLKRCVTAESADILRTIDITKQMRDWMLLMDNPRRKGVTVIASKDGELARAMAGQLVYRSILVDYAKPGMMHPVFKGYKDKIITGEVDVKPLTVLYGFGEDSDRSLLDNVSYIVNSHNNVHIVLCVASSNPLDFARSIGVTVRRIFRISKRRSVVSL